MLMGQSALTAKKIAYVGHSGEIGGAQNCLACLVETRPSGREVCVILPRSFAPGSAARSLIKSGAQVVHLPMRWWIAEAREHTFPWPSLRSRVDAVKATLCAFKPDVVHTNSAVVLEGAIAAAELKIPHVWHIHEILPNHPSLVPLLPLDDTLRIIGGLSAKVICVSHVVRETFLEYVLDDKLIVVPNGIPDPQPRTPPSLNNLLRQLCAAHTDTPLAIAVGSLVPEKDCTTLLKAVQIAHAAGSKVRVAIVGRGTRKAVLELEELVRDFGLTETVHYLGFRDDALSLIAQADMLVQTSCVESFSLTVVEAMALGKPVISTRSGGPQDLIVDGQTGYLTAIGDAAAVAVRLEQLSKDGSMRTSMGLRAHDRYREFFTAENHASKIEQGVYSAPIEPSFSDTDSIVSSIDAEFRRAQRLAVHEAPWRYGAMLARRTVGSVLLRAQRNESNSGRR